MGIMLCLAVWKAELCCAFHRGQCTVSTSLHIWLHSCLFTSTRFIWWMPDWM